MPSRCLYSTTILRLCSLMLALISLALMPLAGCMRDVRPEPPADSIYGRVLDSAGKSVSGATVRLVPLPLPKNTHGVPQGWHIEPVEGWDAHVPSTATERDGSFVLGSSTGTLFQLSVSAGKYATTVVPHVNRSASPLIVTLREGYALRGRILNELPSVEQSPVLSGVGTGGESDDGIFGADVVYRTIIDGGTFERRTTTDRRGAYSFSHLPYIPGKVEPSAATIEVIAEGFAVKVKPVAHAREVGSTSKKPIRQLDLFLDDGGFIDGVVRDRLTQAPIAGATVIVWSRVPLAERQRRSRIYQQRFPFGVRVLGRDVTDAAGRYRCAQIPLDDSVYPPAGWTMGVAVVAPGYSCGGKPVSRFMQGRIARYDIGLSPSATLSGRVVREEGQPCDGAAVVLHANYLTANPGGRTLPQEVTTLLGVPSTVTTDADGAFRIEHVVVSRGRPQKINFGVRGAGLADVMATVSVEARKESTCEDVVVTEAQPRAEEWWRVIDAAQQPIAGVRIYAVDGKSRRPRSSVTVSDSQGRFQISATMRGRALRFVARGYAGITRPPEHFDGEVRSVPLEPAQKLSGVVRSARGKPVEGARVWAYDAYLPAPPKQFLCNSPADEAGYLSSTVSDAKGIFTLDGLGAGPYQVMGLWLPERGFMEQGMSSPLCVVTEEAIRPEEGAVILEFPQECALRRGSVRVTAGGFFSVRDWWLIGEGGEARYYGARTLPSIVEFFDVPAGKYQVAAIGHGNVAEVTLGEGEHVEVTATHE